MYFITTYIFGYFGKNDYKSSNLMGFNLLSIAYKRVFIIK
jgi:hypothetical protein